MRGSKEQERVQMDHVSAVGSFQTHTKSSVPAAKLRHMCTMRIHREPFLHLAIDFLPVQFLTLDHSNTEGNASIPSGSDINTSVSSVAYTDTQRILVVGDGDFSFSRGLGMCDMA